MGQFVGAVSGIGEAARALEFPIVSGNVSFYNETNGKAVQPTPAIGGVGLIEDLSRLARIGIDQPGLTLLLIGKTEGQLGASIYLREIAGREDGAPPPVDLATERQVGDFVRDLIETGKVRICHDVSDGGIAVAVAEMILAGSVGVTMSVPETADHGWWFGEDQARYIVAVDNKTAMKIEADAKSGGIATMQIGVSGGKALNLGPEGELPVNTLRDAAEGWLPAYMDA